MKSNSLKAIDHLKGRFIRPFFYLFLMAYAIDAYSNPQSSLTFELDSTSFSQSTSLYSISGNWNDKISSGNQVWSINRLSLGYQYDDFIVQAVYRKDFNYNFNNETVQFLHLTHNQSNLETGKQYALNISPNKMAAQGIRLGFNLQPTNTVNIQTWISFLQASELLDGQLTGLATGKASNDYDFGFSSDLTYGEDPLFGRQTNGVSGRGYAVDLDLNYQINDELLLSIELKDILGELEFDNVPFTKANATSNIKDFDEDGYVKYNPSISGIDGNKNYIKSLKGRQKVALSYRLSLVKKLLIEHHNVFGFKYQKLKYLQQFNETTVTFSVLPRFKALGVNWKRPNFSFGIETDSFDTDTIKYLNLNAQFFIPF